MTISTSSATPPTSSTTTGDDTTGTDTRSGPVTVVATMRARAGRRHQLRETLTSLIEPTRCDPGMISYALYEDATDADQFCFIEVWDSTETLEQHLDQPHLEALTAREVELVDDAGIQVLRLRLVDRC